MKPYCKGLQTYCTIIWGPLASNMFKNYRSITS